MAILLVEDNELNRDMLSRRLERKGYQVSIAIDGAQGVAMALELMPAIILMDLSLPVMDGWAAIRHLKADPKTAGIPIIALTAHARAEDEKTARDAGADDFDTKPVDLSRLVCWPRGRSPRKSWRPFAVGNTRASAWIRASGWRRKTLRDV